MTSDTAIKKLITDYWRTVGGLLIEEFVILKPEKHQIDGVIVIGEPDDVIQGGSYDVTDRDIIVVLARPLPLDLMLVGHIFFSKQYIMSLNPRTTSAVVICTQSDDELELLCASHGIEVIEQP